VVHRICDAVAVMEAGRIVETGSARDIFTRPREAVTKRFIRQTAPRTEDSVFDPTLFDPAEGALLKLVYVGAQARHAVLADAIRQFDLPINIIHGGVTHTRDAAIGELYVQVPARDVVLRALIEYFEARDIQAEIVREGAAS
jgi:D-methionine transport system ATP-binding protein